MSGDLVIGVLALVLAGAFLLGHDYIAKRMDAGIEAGLTNSSVRAFWERVRGEQPSFATSGWYRMVVIRIWLLMVTGASAWAGVTLTGRA